MILGTVSAVCGAVGLGLALDRTDPGTAPSSAGGTAANGADLGPVVAQPITPVRPATVRPTSISIPSIKVDSSLEELGLTSTGALAVPVRPQDAGWFDGGPLPGQQGPAVVAGHVDSLTGPAVFADLRLLHAGDTIAITLSDGSSVRFQVTSVHSYAKDDFPTAAVYGAQPDPELRLITCGGPFTGQRYLDDVVVFARLRPPAASS